MDGRSQGDAMNSNRVVTTLLLIAALVVVTSPAAAQYMYLDSNGNGVHDSGDRLAPNGTATTVDVWLDTNHNRDGSVATCDADPSQELTLNDYYVNFKAAGGLVSYSGFVTHFGNPPIGQFNPATAFSMGTDWSGSSPRFPWAAPHRDPDDHGFERDAANRDRGSAERAPAVHDVRHGSGCFGNDFDNVLKLAGRLGNRLERRGWARPRHQ
jgi:hypothetical protein